MLLIVHARSDHRLLRWVVRGQCLLIRGYQRQIDMARDTVRLLLKQYGVGNKRAPIPALGNIAFIPQSHHEFVPQFCDGTDADPRRFGLAGEPVSGKAGHDQVEGIARVSHRAESDW